MMADPKPEELRNYINAESIVRLDAVTRDDALQHMVLVAERQGLVNSAEDFLTAVKRREKIASTAVGMGVAIPHARVPWLNDFFIIMAICPKGVDWSAPDGAPCQIICLIGGPDNAISQYQKLLSMLTTKLIENRRQMLKFSAGEDILSALI